MLHRLTLLLAIVVPLGLAACGKSGPPSRCDHYSDMEVKCGGENGGEGVRDISHSYCEKAEKGDDDLIAQTIKPEIECAQTNTACDGYKACIAKAKGE